MSLKGKVALITGGGTGIGEKCARLFAAEGAHVAVMGRRPALIEQVSRAIGCFGVVGDASNTADVKRAISEINTEFGTIDIVVANAGGRGMAPAMKLSDTAWKDFLDSNLNSAFVVIREALPNLISRRGAIVVISSIAGLRAGPDVCGYTTTKHALVGLARSVARDYGPFGVRANVVCPGWVRTPMADEEMEPLMKQQGLTRDEAYALVTRNVPLRRPATAAEIAAICRFLVSDEAAIITGATIVADGGSTIVDVPTLAFA